MLTSQATIMGPRSRARGSCSGPIFRPASRISSRFEERYPAKNMARVILASSPGWKDKPERSCTQIRAPLITTPSPGISGSSSSSTEAARAM